MNHLEREARNASRGAAGEKCVFEVEHRLRREAGKKELAGMTECVSISKGDGLGLGHRVLRD